MRIRLTTLGPILIGGWLLGAGCGPAPRETLPFEEMTPTEQILAFEAAGVQIEGAPPVLRRLLRHRSPIIRAHGAELLAARAAQDQPRLVLPALAHKDPLVRGMAQASYIEHNPYGMAPVITKGAVVEVPPRVLDALARLEAPYGRVDLEQVIADRRAALRQALDTAPETAVLAADILARVGDAGARRRILELIDEADGPVLTKAVRAAVRNTMGLGPTVLPLAFDKSVDGRRAVMRAMVTSPDPRLQSLMRRGLQDVDAAVRRNAIRALGNLGASAPVDLLAAMLEGKGGETVDALRALGVIGLPAANVLRAYIRSSETGPALQVHAMMALAPNAGRPDIGWACSRLDADNMYLRAAAASVLGRIGHPEAQAALVAARTDTEPLVRAAVAKALGQIGTIYAANHLLDMLHDPSPLVASMAAWGLGATGYPKAVPALVKVMTTHKSRKGVPVFVGEMYGRPELAATEALGRIRSEEARTALRRALEASSWRVRAAAVDALAAAADRSDATIGALEQRLDDPVNLVRAKTLLALESLGKTYEPEALQTR